MSGKGREGYRGCFLLLGVSNGLSPLLKGSCSLSELISRWLAGEPWCVNLSGACWMPTSSSMEGEEGRESLETWVNSKEICYIPCWGSVALWACPWTRGLSSERSKPHGALWEESILEISISSLVGGISGVLSAEMTRTLKNDSTFLSRRVMKRLSRISTPCFST